MATIRNLLIRISVSENLDRGVRKVTGELQKTNREVDRADKGSNRFSSTLSKLGKTSLSKLTSGMTALRTTTMLAAKAVTVFALAAGSLNTAVQLGSSLAPLAGLLTAIPGVALAAAAAIGTLKLATSGMSDAFKAAMGSDPKKFAEALKNLSPAARSVAIELHKLAPTLTVIRLAAQQALFVPLRGQLTAIARVLAGPVRQGVIDVGNQFGLAGKQVALFARQSATAGAVRTIFGTVAESIHQILPAIQPVLAGFRDLAVAATPVFAGVAAGIGRAAAGFGRWMSSLADSGRVEDILNNALTVLRQLGFVAVQVGGILKSIFQAAGAAGNQFLGVIGSALANLNQFLKTAQGQAALKSIFAALGAIGAALGPVIKSLATQLGVLAGPLGRLATLVGPILTVAINALGPALAALEPGLQALFGGFGQAVTLLAPALLPLGRAIAQIGVAIGPILPLVGRLVGQLVTALAPILGRLFIALGPLVGAIIKLAGAFVPLIPPLATIIVQIVQGLVPAITPLIGIFGQIVGVIGSFLIGALQDLMKVLIPMLPTISGLAQTLGTQFLTILIALSPALLDVLNALLPLLPSLINLLPPLVRLVTILTPVIVLFIKVAAVILRNVLPVLVAVINLLLRLVAVIANAVVGAVGWLVKTLGGIGRWVISAFAGAGKWLYGAGRAILIGLWNGIVSMGSWIYRQLGNLIKSIIPGPIRAVLGIHSPSRVTTELGKLTGMGLALGLTGTAHTVRRAANTLALAAIPAHRATPGAGRARALVLGGGPSATAASLPGLAGSAAGGTVRVIWDWGKGNGELKKVIQKMVRIDGGGNVAVAFGGNV